MIPFSLLVMPETTTDDVTVRYDSAEFVRPCAHGMVVDLLLPEGKRAHVRVFTYEPGTVAGTATELPRALDLGEFLGILRTVAEQTREAALAGVLAGMLARKEVAS